MNWKTRLYFTHDKDLEKGESEREVLAINNHSSTEWEDKEIQRGWLWENKSEEFSF